MVKKIGIWNLKGGVGKTTSTLNICAGLAALGYKVLAIDMDPQANLSSFLIREKMKNKNYLCVTDMFNFKTVGVKEMIYHTDYNFDLIGSSLGLTNAEISVRMNPMVEQKTIVASYLKEVENEYDFIIMDCPPALNLLTTNVTIYSDLIITPINTEDWAADGYVMVAENLRMGKRNLGVKAKHKVLLNEMTKGQKMDKDTIRQIESMGIGFDTTIRRQDIFKKGGENKVPVLMEEKPKNSYSATLEKLDEETGEWKIIQEVPVSYNKFKAYLKNMTEDEYEYIGDGARYSYKKETTLIPDIGTDYRNLVDEIIEMVQKGEI